MKRRGLFVLCCTVVSLALGALREFMFLNLNYQIDHVARHTRFSYAHSLFQGWVHDWSLSQLTVLKWTLAVAFIAAMLGLSIVLARMLFHDRRLDRPILVGFAAIGCAALLLHGLAHWLPRAEAVSVKLLHLIQYPVLLVFIWAASLLPRAAEAPGTGRPT